MMPDVHDIIRTARKAGKAILAIYEKDFSVSYKDDRSPLTEADIASHDIIDNELARLYPDIPLLSEESKEIPFEERRKWDTFWLVDPIDGTKEFVKKNGEFTVNIALIEEGIPVMGVVYVPVADTLYYMDGEKSYKMVEDGASQALPCINDKDGFVVVASKSHMSEDTLAFVDRLREAHPDLELRSAGSSLKICLVAEGSADIYPRLGPTMEWDTAAAHAVALGAGKNINIYDTHEPLIYNKENLLNPWFVVQ